jgi:MarR family transcriptional regulator for hemolysin
MEKQNLTLLELGKMMRNVFRALKKRSDKLMQVEIKISPEQFSLLYAIRIKENEVIQKDMAEMMGKDKSAILRLIDTLEEKKLVQRVVDSKDKRKNFLMITKLGNQVIDQYKKAVDDTMKELLQGLSQSEIGNFHKVVCHLMNNARML